MIPIASEEGWTWAPCTGRGTKEGAWTFAHLMRGMSALSGEPAEEFVLEWLSLWLNDTVVNGDTVEALVH